jgi:hypothetical protein
MTNFHLLQGHQLLLYYKVLSIYMTNNFYLFQNFHPLEGHKLLLYYKILTIFSTSSVY